MIYESLQTKKPNTLIYVLPVIHVQVYHNLQTVVMQQIQTSVVDPGGLQGMINAFEWGHVVGTPLCPGLGNPLFKMSGSAPEHGKAKHLYLTRKTKLMIMDGCLTSMHSGW